MVDRFDCKISTEPNSGCWLWMGTITEKGYGRFWDGSAMVQAHRFSYERYKGIIADGLELDHLCRVRSCVNPDHLEPVTGIENRTRGALARGFWITESTRKNLLLGSDVRKRRTHCLHGHEYTPSNTTSDAEGYRRCVTCRRYQNSSRVRAGR